MSSVIIERSSAEDQRRPVFTGAGKWFAAALLLFGSLLQMAEFLLVPANVEPAARVAYWASNLTRVGVSMTVGLLAVPLLIGGFAVLVALTRGRSPRLAWTAGSLMILAMVGLAAIGGAEQAAYWLTLGGDQQAAAKLLNAGDVGLPGAVLMVLFLGGAVLGSLTLAVAMWRSPYLPRIAAVGVVLFVVVDIAVGQPVIGHVISVIWSAISAWAVLTGYVRHPRAGATGAAAPYAVGQ